MVFLLVHDAIASAVPKRDAPPRTLLQRSLRTHLTHLSSLEEQSLLNQGDGSAQFEQASTLLFKRELRTTTIQA